MNYARLMYVTMLMVILFRGNKDIDIIYEAPEIQYIYNPLNSPNYIPLPPDREWYSFIDQKTGLWKR